jgi:formate dehydrogenase maturation protein FdhE
MKKLLLLIVCVSAASIHGMFHNDDTAKYDTIAFHAKKFRNYSPTIYDYPNYTKHLDDQLKSQSKAPSEISLGIIKEEKTETAAENPSRPPISNAPQVDRSGVAESLEQKLAKIFASEQKLTEIQAYIEQLTPDDRSMLLNVLDTMISDELNKYRQSSKKYDNAHFKRASMLAKLQKLLNQSPAPKDYTDKIINNKYCQ